MEFFKSCNGCGSTGLKDINSNNLQICNKCLLISRKFNNKLKFISQETFKKNKEYEWKLKNFKDRSEKNYYFFKQILNFTKLNKKDEILDFGSGYGS